MAACGKWSLKLVSTPELESIQISFKMLRLCIYENPKESSYAARRVYNSFILRSFQICKTLAATRLLYKVTA